MSSDTKYLVLFLESTLQIVFKSKKLKVYNKLGTG